MPLDLSIPFGFHGILSTIGPRDVIDILIVAAILYKVYEMLADTRAITLVKGLLVLLSLTAAASFFQLHVIAWLLQKTLTLILVQLSEVAEVEVQLAILL